MEPPDKKETDHGIRSLRDALAGQHGEGKSREKRNTALESTSSGSSDAMKTLRGLAQGRAASGASRPVAPSVPASQAEDLKKVLAGARGRDAPTTGGAAISTGRRGNAPSPASRDSALAAGNLRGILAGQSAPERLPEAALAEIPGRSRTIKDAIRDVETQAETASTGTQTSSRKKTALWLTAPALAACLVVAGWFFHAGRADQPPSELAAMVQRLGQQVAEQRRTSGALPDRLAGLPAFPSGALEMPINYYAARLLEPRLEVFYVIHNAREFSLIGRYGDQAWMYSSDSPKPLRAVPSGMN